MRQDTPWFERLLLLQAFFRASRDADDVVVHLAEHSKERRFNPGDYLHTLGSPIDRVFFIFEGKVEMRIGDVFRRSIVSPGGAGFFASLAGAPNGHDTIALEPTTCLEVEFRVFKDLLEENFVMLRNMVTGMASQALSEVQKMKFYPALVEPVPPRYTDGELTLIDRIWLLQSLPMFEATNVDALAEIASDSDVERYEAGEVVWNRGEPGNQMVVVFSGGLSCVNEETHVNFEIRPGQVAGGLSAFAAEPRWFTATATEETCVLKLPVQSILDVIEDNFDMGLGMAGLLAGYIILVQIAGQNPDKDLSNFEL